VLFPFISLMQESPETTCEPNTSPYDYLIYLKADLNQIGYGQQAISQKPIANRQQKMTTEFANTFAHEWIDSWNGHDLEMIISHYADDLQFYSPVIKQLGVNEKGIITDKQTLKAYFAKGLQVYPDLYFNFHEVLAGTNSLVIYYTSINNRKSAEMMQFDKNGKVNLVRAHYSN